VPPANKTVVILLFCEQQMQNNWFIRLIRSMSKILFLFFLDSILLISGGCRKQIEPTQKFQKFSFILPAKLLQTKDSISIHLNINHQEAQYTHINWSTNIGRIEGAGADIKYYAPDTQGLTKIVASISDGINISYSDTVRIQIYKQLIILKADDMAFDSVNIISSRWRLFVDYIKSKNIIASLGIIGNSLEKGNDSYYSYLKSLADSGRFELWNHGYTHILNGVDKNGMKYEEFLKTSIEYQKEHLLKTQSLALEKLNIILHTFGAPGNAIDTTTTKAVDAFGEIKVWFFGLSNSDKFVLDRSIEIEYPTGNPDFNKFQLYYNPLKTYIVLQIHPNNWDEKKFSEFEKSIDFLIQKGVTFINPYEYYQLTH
jgi:hypothetical protein